MTDNNNEDAVIESDEKGRYLLGQKNENEDEIDIGPFLKYLEGEKGHELASRILGVVEDIKKVNLEKTSNQAKFEKWLQVGIIIVVVVSTSLLTYFDKFDSATGILFGSLVGYMFGKR